MINDLHEDLSGVQVEEVMVELGDNIDRPDRHNVNPMNRPSRVIDPIYNTHDDIYGTEEDIAFEALEKSIEEKKNAGMHSKNYQFNLDITFILKEIQEMLMSKNKKYGNSALEPIRIFSKADSVEQIKVRIDDKLSRIATASTDEDEDVRKDLIGYLVLLKLAQK